MKKYLYIAILGAFGAITRYVFEKAPFQLFDTNFPIKTLAINLLGCFVLSLIIEYSFERKNLSNSQRLGITTGFLGAFTTFSTLCKETVDLLNAGQYAFALIYILASIALGLLAIELANKLVKKILVNKSNEASENTIGGSK